MSTVRVRVSRRAAARLRAGHPWVRSADVASVDRGGDGDVAEVVDDRGRTLGTGLYAEGGRIAVRMLAREAVELDERFFEARIEAALELRRRLLPGADAYRVVHAEADGLAGLIVDRYADAAVLQTTAAAMDRREELIARVVGRVLGVRLVVARDDGSARDFEGLPRRKGIVLGRGPALVRYHDAGSLVEVDLLVDGKTGGFLDQVENHGRAAAYARGAALDAFSYHGGFALALARAGCTAVLALDENSAAIERVRRNADLNGYAQIEARVGNAFDELRRMEAEGRRFDTVVIDPPALAKRQSGVPGAERAYKELNLRGLRLLAAQGVLISCSCSGQVSPQAFGEILAAAAADSGRTVQLVERRGAGCDHPTLMGVPETEYLKCFILRVIE